MDKISKALKRFSEEEQDKINRLLILIKNGAFSGLDLKKLKGRDDIFRIRKGKIRILYRIDDNNEIYILAIERRSDNTYNF
ncbi:MAG: type II toxin-antitoxin system RelE/ParE family toxin [bacterium]